MEKLSKRKDAQITLKSNIVDLKRDKNVKLYQYSISLPQKTSDASRRKTLGDLERKVLELTQKGAIVYYDHLYTSTPDLEKQSIKI